MKQFHLLKAKKFTWFLLAACTVIVQLSFVGSKTFGSGNVSVHDTTVQAVGNVNAGSSFLANSLAVYDSLHLADQGLSVDVFEMALKGMEKLLQSGITQKDNIIAIADFSQPSTNKRLYIVDLDNYELKFRTWVAHGRRSGAEMASHFSNKVSSNQSSPGFYVTGSTYQGKHGYSLKLEGVETGINDNASRRAIVIHGADYVNPNIIPKLGYIGRSQGCPAIPMNLHRPVIDQLKDGACLFIYSPADSYIKKSSLIG
ncbi:MAG TPA: murein L,D-transpeptidase catalytic domain family protein [Flavitalea sp.]|nr:murein L,D-transpeptidase catalytic domain family protein [Flavitalea sp.]